jgi:outer membrane biosynthesis protein TonB
MLSLIIALCATAMALWSIVFWTRERTFRLTVIISTGIHALLLIPFGGIRPNVAIAPSRPRLLQYTFIRGTPEEMKSVQRRLAEIPGKETKEALLPKTDTKATARNDELPLHPNEKETRVTEAQTENELPEIENVKWFPFENTAQGKSYRREIKRLIKANLEIPEEILRDGYEGKQVIYFKLSRDGRLKTVFIDPRYRSSRDLVNTTSIENIARISEKFPPLPKEVKKDEIWFHVEIDYQK